MYGQQVNVPWRTYSGKGLPVDKPRLIHGGPFRWPDTLIVLGHGSRAWISAALPVQWTNSPAFSEPSQTVNVCAASMGSRPSLEEPGPDASNHSQKYKGSSFTTLRAESYHVSAQIPLSMAERLLVQLIMAETPEVDTLVRDLARGRWSGGPSCARKSFLSPARSATRRGRIHYTAHRPSFSGYQRGQIICSPLGTCLHSLPVSRALPMT